MHLIFLLIARAFSASLETVGFIEPTSHLPISLSANNAGEIVDYTFSFKPARDIMISDNIIIEFPRQFTSALDSILCEMTCTVFDTKITLTSNSNIHRGSELSIKIRDVSNPNYSGGTGPFGISIYSRNILTQINSVFGVIGISEAPGSLSSTQINIDTNGSSVVNTLTYNLISFKTQSTLLKGN